MLCGAFDLSGGPGAELAVVRRIAARFPDAQTRSLGPLAFAGGPTSAACEANGIHCVFEGRLHGPHDPVDPRERALAGAEAAARGYRRSGKEILAALRGSYSVAIWDEERKQGLLSCDSLATRQWFTWRGSGYLLFATELRDLLAIVPARPGPDPVGFLMWLAGGTCPEGVTLYEDVSRLGPGELVELSHGTAQTSTHRETRYAGTLQGSGAELAGALREHLEQATATRLSSRANGIVLSGGLDSSIVTAFAARTRPAESRLRPYSAVFPGADFDESDKIAELTGALGLDPAAFRIEPQGTIRLALEYATRWELPLMGPGALIDTTIVTEAARDGADVVLDGQTGDEVLGFAPYLVADRLRQGRLLAALELTRQWPIGRPTTRHQKVRILRDFGLKKAAPVPLARWVARRRRAPRAPVWLLEAHRRRFEELEDRWAWKTRSSGPLWWRYLADVLISAPHRELRLDYLRHRAAAVGVVNESPLYDFDLIDLCLRLPPELAFDRRFARPLAREAVAGIVPEAVRLQTQKADFASFCADAIAGPDARGIERLLIADEPEIGAYVDMNYVRTLWRHGHPGATRGSTSWAVTVWRLAAAECWLRRQTGGLVLDELVESGDAPAPSVQPVSLAASTFFPLAKPPHSV
jgi:asparagine synthase (glutamine-hydrolysing)